MMFQLSIEETPLNFYPKRLYTSFLTEDPSCCVFGALFCCRRDSKLNAGWVKAQMKKVSESVDVRTVNGVHVSVLDLPTADMLSLPRRLIDIPSGRFERYAPMLRRNLSFERIGRLGYTVGRLEFWANHSRQETVNVDEFLRETCVSIEDEYTGSDILDSDDFLVEKVKDIQVRDNSIVNIALEFIKHPSLTEILLFRHFRRLNFS